jgi:hypothetical protein
MPGTGNSAPLPVRTVLGKYYIYSVIVAFFFGLVVAGVGTSIFIRGHVETNLTNMDRSYLAAWEQHSIDAYENESSEVAVWVLQNFIGLLQSRLERASGKDRNRMHRNLVQAYARLAYTFKEKGSLSQYEKNLPLALELGRRVYPDTIATEADLFHLLTRAEVQ